MQTKNIKIHSKSESAHAYLDPPLYSDLENVYRIRRFEVGGLLVRIQVQNVDIFFRNFFDKLRFCRSFNRRRCWVTRATLLKDEIGDTASGKLWEISFGTIRRFPVHHLKQIIMRIWNLDQSGFRMVKKKLVSWVTYGRLQYWTKWRYSTYKLVLVHRYTM